MPWWACNESPPPGAVAAVATGDSDLELPIFSMSYESDGCLYPGVCRRTPG